MVQVGCLEDGEIWTDSKEVVERDYVKAFVSRSMSLSFFDVADFLLRVVCFEYELDSCHILKFFFPVSPDLARLHVADVIV